MTEIFHISSENGRWADLLKQWDQECASFSESFDDYQTGTLSVLRPLAEQGQVDCSGVFAIQDESAYIGMCQLNVAYLPGYDDKVLRVRHIVHSPKFDFDDNLGMDDYTSLLIELFLGIFSASYTEMPAPYIKFHFRSPAERAFFSSFKEALDDKGHFEDIVMRGSWLYIKKKST